MTGCFLQNGIAYGKGKDGIVVTSLQLPGRSLCFPFGDVISFTPNRESVSSAYQLAVKMIRHAENHVRKLQILFPFLFDLIISQIRTDDIARNGSR